MEPELPVEEPQAPPVEVPVEEPEPEMPEKPESEQLLTEILAELQLIRMDICEHFPVEAVVVTPAPKAKKKPKATKKAKRARNW